MRAALLLVALGACGASHPHADPVPDPATETEPATAAATATATAPAPPDAPPPPTCDALPDAIERVLRSQLAQVPVDQKDKANAVVGAMMPSIRDAVRGACTDDGWSAAAISCMALAETTTAWERCAPELTPAQQTGLTERLSAAQPSPR